MRAPITREPIPRHPVLSREDHLSIVREEPASEPLPALQAPAPKEPSHFVRFAGMIGRQYPAIFITTLIALAAAMGMLHFATPLYTTSAQIMIQRVATNSVPAPSDDRQRALRSEQELIVSTPVLASALTMPGVHDIAPLRGRPDALKLIKQQIRVDTGRSDDLLNITYDSADPREGTRLLAAVVDSYVRFRSGLHGALTDGSATTVQTERQKAVETVKQRRAAFQQFCADHGLAQGNEQVDAADEAMHELGVRLAQAHVQTVAARAAYDQMQHDLVDDPRMRDRLMQFKDNDSSLAAGDDLAIAKQIVTLQTQLAGYGTKFMANYEPVQLLHRKIDDLKLTRDAIVQQRWQQSVRTESELQASYDQEEVTAAHSEADEQMFDQRKTDVAEAQKQVAAFDKQLKDLDAVNKLITTMVTVIEPAAASDRPTSPRTAWILLVAAVTGLSLGLGVAGLCDRRVQIESPGNLKMLGEGLPMLARLPAVSRMQLSMNSWRDRLVDSAAEFAEACRKVQGALEAVASFSGGRTVLVTSASAGEGKSTLTSLLALTLAQTGKRVLLVDANLHAPQQGKIFGIEGDFGLGQLLEEEIESSFVSHVHPGSDQFMDILLAGAASLSIEELLNSQRFTNLMAAMASEYDYVLIDSPALSAGTDARVIASSCDATIILASESNIDRKSLNKTRDSLTSVAANVIGVVINGGMVAAARRDALPAADKTEPAPVRVTTIRPAPVVATTVEPAVAAAVSAVVEPVQSVFATHARRTVDSDQDLLQPQDESDREGSIWSYLLVLILLIAGWMTFHGLCSQTAAAKASVVSSQPESVGILMAGGGLLVIMLLAGFQARPPRRELALVGFTALLGICSFCGGAMSTPWSAQQTNTAIASAAQTVLLFASLLLGWFVASRLTTARDERESAPTADQSLAIFAQTSVMAALMILLSSWHSKGECLAVIAFSSCLAAMLAYWMAPVRSSLFMWLSPLVVALFGYGCAVVAAHGMRVGMLVALARPLPMDYASMGPIGALLGFWIAKSAGRFVWPSPLMAD